MVKTPIYSKLLKINYLGEFLVILFSDIFLYLHNRKCYNIKLESTYRYYINNHNGFLKSLLSTIRNINLTDHNYNNSFNGLVIFSKDDRLITFNSSKIIRYPCIEFELYGHCELIEPSKKIIINFLKN